MPPASPSRKNVSSPSRRGELRLPPQSLDAEKALLGSIMQKAEGMHDVVDIISPESFYAEKNRLIYRAMLDLFGRSEPIDLLTVSGKLEDGALLQNIGGKSYLAELVNSVPTATNLKHYANIVQKKAMQRALIEASAEIGEMAYDESRELEELLDTAEKRIYDVTATPTLRTFLAIREALGDAWERLDRLHKSDGDMGGVPTGFKQLDNLLAGLHKSDLVILAARPSMGKTALALDIARQTATRHNTPVGIFSLEMSSEQLVDRMLAAESRVNSWNIRTGKNLSEEDFGLLSEAMDRLSTAPIFIDDQASNNILTMRASARRLKREHGVGLIVVDYLQLMVPTNARASDSMVQQVTEISRALKGMARELDVPVLALSQLSRAVETRRGKPRLSDLRDSGCLTADTLIQRADTGERVPIHTLVGKTNIPVVSLDASYQLRNVLASKVFSSGTKRIFALTLRSGRTIKASGNHQFLTLSGWQSLDALQERDRIASPRFLKPSTPPSSLSKDELILLAHLLGDGCVLPRQPIHYTSADTANLEAVEQAAHALFGIVPRRVKQKNWWHSYLPSPVRLTRGRHHPITNWYHALGIAPVRSYEKRIPQAVFSADSISIQLFLHHLWATDGNISWKLLQGRKPSAALYYATTSRGLAEDVQHLLLRLGIWSTVRTATKKGYRNVYQVHVQSAPVQLRFLELVGSYGARGLIVPELIKALRDIAPIPNTDAIPREVWDLAVTPEKNRVGKSWRDIASSMEVSYNGSALQATGVSRLRLAQVAATLQSETLTHLAESDVYWDEVVSIESLGEEEVFDMTVPGTHNFVAGDIVVHNSIEQDADVVMFIHRDDKMNENSDRPNIAEILVEKHRNGPTGMVELFFDDKRTTFLPVEKSDFGAITAATTSEEF